MKILHLAIALALAMPLCASGEIDVKKTGTQGYLSRGVLMYGSGNYVGALDQLSQVTPDRAGASEVEDARFYSALSHYELRHRESVVELVDFIHAYPSSHHVPYAWATVGDHYFFNGRFGDAVRTYEQVPLNAPDLDTAEDVEYRKAYAMLRLCRYDDARGAFTRLGNTPRYRGAGQFYTAYINYAKGDYAKAKKDFAAVKGNPTLSYYSQYYLAQIAFAEKDYEKTLQMSKSLLRDKNKDFFTPELLRLEGESQYQLGNYDEAHTALESYVNACDEAPMRSAAYAKGVIEYRRGDYAAAVNSLGSVVDDNDALAQSSYLYIGQSSLKLGENNAAVLAFEKAVSLDYDRNVTETAYYNYAVAQNQGGRTPFSNGIEVLETFLNRFPNSRYTSEVSQYLVGSYLSTKDYAKALKSISMVKNPDDKVLKAKQFVQYNLGMQALRNNDAVQARQYLKEATETPTGDYEISDESRLWLAEAQYRLGEYAAAEKNQRLYLSTSPKSKNVSVAHYNLGYSLFQQKNYTDAASHFKTAVKGLTGDTQADAFARLGDTQYYTKQYSAACAYYTQAYDLHGAKADYALYQTAVMQGLTKKYDEKISSLNALLKEFPSSSLAPSAMLEKASAQIASGSAKAATTTYTQLVEKYPKSTEARQGLLQLAINERNQGSNDKAITHYKKVIETYPTSDEARLAAEDLKLIYADQGRISEFASYINNVPNAPRIDVSEVERLTFQAAEKSATATKSDITKMRDYLSKYPTGAYAAHAQYYIAKYEYQRKNYDDALAAVNQALTHTDAPFAEDALAIKSEILMRKGNNAEAMSTYKALEAKASSNDTKIIANLGIMRASAEDKKWNDVRAAATTLQQIGGLTADEENEALFFHALAAKHLGKADEAQKYYSQLAASPASLYGARAAYNLAEMQYEGGNMKAAEKTINAFIDEGTPHHYWLAKGFILLADIYHKQGRDFEAKEYLQSLKSNYPGSENDIFTAIDKRLDEWKTSTNSKSKKK